MRCGASRGFSSLVPPAILAATVRFCSCPSCCPSTAPLPFREDKGLLAGPGDASARGGGTVLPAGPLCPTLSPRSSLVPGPSLSESRYLDTSESIHLTNSSRVRTACVSVETSLSLVVSPAAGKAVAPGRVVARDASIPNRFGSIIVGCGLISYSIDYITAAPFSEVPPVRIFADSSPNTSRLIQQPGAIPEGDFVPSMDLSSLPFLVTGGRLRRATCKSKRTCMQWQLIDQRRLPD